MNTITVDSRLLDKAWRDYAPKVTFNFGKLLEKMTEDEFFEFCQENSELRIEMDKRERLKLCRRRERKRVEEILL